MVEVKHVTPIGDWRRMLKFFLQIVMFTKHSDDRTELHDFHLRIMVDGQVTVMLAMLREAQAEPSSVCL